jgi:hypothetical protein
MSAIGLILWAIGYFFFLLSQSLFVPIFCPMPSLLCIGALVVAWLAARKDQRVWRKRSLWLLLPFAVPILILAYGVAFKYDGPIGTAPEWRAGARLPDLVRSPDRCAVARSRAGQPTGRARHFRVRLGAVLLHGTHELYVGDERLAMNRLHDTREHEHAAIAWHDSDLIAITRMPTALVIDLRAIVHRSHGSPGTDPGTVWLQPAAMILSDAQPMEDSPDPPGPDTIAYGEIATTEGTYESMIRCPFTSNGEACLELTLASGESLRFDADQLTITFTGEPEFLDDFVPERIEDDPGF